MALTIALLFVVVWAGIALAPALARLTAAPSLLPHRASARTTTPDWGGGHLSLISRPTEQHPDSAAAARRRSLPAGGVSVRRLRDGDHSLAMALPAGCPATGTDGPSLTALFELPSSRRFRTQLLPGSRDAAAPAPDIPLYPGAVCRTQVGHGTACFIGFYLAPDSIAAVRSFYLRTLGRSGWRRVGTDDSGAVMTFARPAEDRTVAVQLRRQGPATTRIGVVALNSNDSGRCRRRQSP